MPDSQRSYHHGDVRAASIEAALRLVGESGEQAVTMRAVAQAIGVDHRAVYRQFADRDDLMNCVAASGYEALLETMATAQDPRALHSDIAHYLDFSLAHMELQALMLTRSRLHQDSHERLAASVGAVLDRLMASARQAVDGQDDLRDENAKALALGALATAYGFISLERSSTLMPRQPETLRTFLREQVFAAIDGRLMLMRSPTD